LSLIVFASDITARTESNYLQANAHLIADATALVDGGIQRATEAVTTESARVAALAGQVGALRQDQVDPSANDPQIQQAQQELTQLLARQAKADDEVQAAETFASSELGGIKGPGNSGIAGDGPRHKAAQEEVANAKRHAQEIAIALDAARARIDALRKQFTSANDATRQRSDDQLPGFETALAAENAKLSTMKDELANLTQGRDDAIRKAVENAPDHVGRDDGLLAQLMALEHIAQSDPKIAAVIVLIDVTSFGFELAAVLAKVTSFVPTTYAALLARDAYMRVVRIVDDMAVELNGGAGKGGAEAEILPRGAPVNDNRQGVGPVFAPAPFGSPDNPPQPPKRPRGRPRKSSSLN
jgi:hypothetical protein